MLGLVKRILNLAGEYARNVKIAFVVSIFEGIFAKGPIVVVLYILMRIVENQVTSQEAYISGGIIVASVILRAIAARIVDQLQSGTGYHIFARERMKIGDRLKRLPMGYFTEGNIGNIMAVITSDIIFVEEYSMHTLSEIVASYISTVIGIIMIMVIDYRLGIIALITILLANFMLKGIEKVTIRHSGIRQEAQSKLVSSVIEFVKGIAVIKAFNMIDNKGERLDQEFKEYRDVSIDFEEKFGPPLRLFLNSFALGISAIILAVAYFTYNQTLDRVFMLMMLIFVFELFVPFKVLGSVNALIRIMEVALDRYDTILKAEIIDEDGRDIELTHYDIEFDHVTFAYEEEVVLSDISFKVEACSMTALVGKSGCGKTTIANLIARFWDVQEGAVLVGGVNIKEMTCDSLLTNMSMVFQNVYLFRDTILNNIRMGKPSATVEEVMEAAKKARCHEFIMAYENGYETMIGEGGSTVSGGEKQRISIARAILKDAPIILLDEATASVDPDNEKYIQMAISELVKNKTLIVIAHKLSTIKNADQILVIDNGRIIQSGKHVDLVKEEGQYLEFWTRRVKARSWEISAEVK